MATKLATLEVIGPCVAIGFASMAEIPIASHALRLKPGDPGGLDGYRWHVHIAEGSNTIDYLVVDLSASQASMTDLSDSELDERIESALQRHAAGRLDNYLDVREQISRWDGPIVLRAEDFAD